MTTIFKSFKKTKTCSIDFEASNLLFGTQNLVHRRTNRLFSIHNLLNFVKGVTLPLITLVIVIIRRKNTYFLRRHKYIRQSMGTAN